MVLREKKRIKKFPANKYKIQILTSITPTLTLKSEQWNLPFPQGLPQQIDFTMSICKYSNSQFQQVQTSRLYIYMYIIHPSEAWNKQRFDAPRTAQHTLIRLLNYQKKKEGKFWAKYNSNRRINKQRQKQYLPSRSLTRSSLSLLLSPSCSLYRLSERLLLRRSLSLSLSLSRSSLLLRCPRSSLEPDLCRGSRSRSRSLCRSCDSPPPERDRPECSRSSLGEPSRRRLLLLPSERSAEPLEARESLGGGLVVLSKYSYSSGSMSAVFSAVDSAAAPAGDVGGRNPRGLQRHKRAGFIHVDIDLWVTFSPDCSRKSTK